MQSLSIIDLICKDEEIIPRFHCRERGDIYSLLAILYLQQNRTDDALSMIEKMAEYDTKVLPEFVPCKKLNTPLLCNAEHNFYWTAGDYKERLLRKLESPAFDMLKGHEKFVRIMEHVRSL